MRFEWDERKRLENLKKHGLDFADAEDVFSGESVTVRDERFDYGETRYVTFGLLSEVVVALAHTENDDLIRIISFRKATFREEGYYYAKIRD